MLDTTQPESEIEANAADGLDRLVAEKAALCREIRNYPQPIAGCDVQFNWLCEQRDAIAQKIVQLSARR